MLNVANCRKAVVLSCVLLAGCGGAASVPLGEQYNGKVDQFYAIDGLNIPANYTPESAMPSTGAVTYTGVGYVFYSDNGQQTDLVGDASIEANFGTDAMTGSLNNFVGGPLIGGSVEDISVFKGSLTMSGEIGTVAAGCNACFEGQLSGTLSGQGDTVQMNSALLGDFYGQGYERIGGFTLNGNTVLVNGVVSNGGSTIVAER